MNTNLKKETVLKFYAKYKMYIFPSLVALSSLFLIVVVIFPQVSKLISNQSAVGKLVNKSSFLENKVQALESYNKEDLSREVNYALVVFPQDRDFGGIIGLMQQIAGQSGFTITGISIGNASVQIKNATSFEVRLEAQGARNLLPIFFRNLENSRRLIKVNSFGITSGAGSQVISTSLVLDILFSQAPKDYGTIDSPLPELTQKDQELIATLASLSSAPVSASPSATQFGTRGKANPFE